MRLIDAIVYRKILEKEKESWDRCVGEVMGLEVAIADLGDMPTIDAVPVVRCKDCKHNVANWNHNELDATDYSDITCDYFMTDGMHPDDFCSYGERRETHET